MEIVFLPEGEWFQVEPEVLPPEGVWFTFDGRRYKVARIAWTAGRHMLYPESSVEFGVTIVAVREDSDVDPDRFLESL